MATVKYLDVRDLQRPFDPGVLDANSRALRVFNVVATKVPSVDPELEVVRYLQDHGVGVEGATLFAGAHAVVPSGDGPYLTVSATGGPDGIRTHNVTQGPAYERPTFQVTVRARSVDAAVSMVWAAYNLLTAIRNQDLVVP